jgi:hypothetical protein
MTACTQPGCTGTIVDGYCDVCGSPAGAVPFVSAAGSAAPPAPADEPGLTAVQASAPAPAPVDEEIPTQLIPRVKMPRQQSSTHEMADPGAADPGPDHEEIPTQLIPRVKMPRQQSSTPEMTDPGAADPGPDHEEIPTQLIPRVKMPRQQSSTHEMVDPGAADRGAVDAQKVDEEKVDGEQELAEHEPDGAQDYRTRVEKAQLPYDVHKVALCEVGKLEQTSDQDPEFGDIRTWLDTILDLPWSTKTDLIDLQGSREVEATLRRLIEPAVADIEEGDTAEVEPAVADIEMADTAEVEPAVGDIEEGDTAEVEPAVADIEKADTAPAGPEHDDTIKMPGVPAVFSRGGYLSPQLPEQRVLGPEPAQTPAEKRRESLVLAATALALLISALLFAPSGDGAVTPRSVPTVTTTATATVTNPTSEPSNESTDTGGEGPTIQLENLADSARPFQTVRIEGTYRGGADTFLRVQRWEGGKWLAFPLPAKTDKSGQFTTFVEFGRPGRYRLRVGDPDSGVRSKTFVLVIAG